MKLRWRSNPWSCLCHPPCGGCGLKSIHWASGDYLPASPSMRRVWIEMYNTSRSTPSSFSHPPCGGCGLKSDYPTSKCGWVKSPSMRRVWIEIWVSQFMKPLYQSPSMRRVWIEIPDTINLYHQKRSHPPCGGCGLKYWRTLYPLAQMKSPSMRRVWIEI